MFKLYVKDKIWWILFFALVLIMSDLLIYLDNGISVNVTSLVYFNIVMLAFFGVFFLIRFFRETKFWRELELYKKETVRDWGEIPLNPTTGPERKVKEVLLHASEEHQREVSELTAAQISSSDYTAAWVHEAKTPLTAMKLIIDEHRGNPEIRRMEAEWLRLFLLIDQQLYISRIPSLQKDYLIEEAELDKLAAKEVKELSSWCMEKNIAVEFEGTRQTVFTDEKWTRFIIRQVLTNAVKYSPPSATITINTSMDAAGYAILEITDEGPGIAVHELPRVFDKGFTGENGRLHHAGTGLGLYLAKIVADRLHIHLTASSMVGEGTTIRLSFPHKNDFDQVRP